ncbi:MAG: anaerobic ribonucleoside-triphosphate reductase activating protein [Eubacterium sp.]|nr:anaerobic ribonucleoside-triphosphate reductase activating protein [Eubacterium sp.]
MKIHGLQKMTLLDYPGKVACTVFLGGCEYRCPYCHNTELLDMNAPELMNDIELLEFLKTRQKLLDGVAVTGGEPLLRNDIASLLERIKNLGFLVKLDTNGNHPDRLQEVVEAGLVDYVAMDVKNSRERYGETIGLPGFNISRVERSVEYLLSDIVEYEFRTTVVKQFHDEKSFEDMAEWIDGAQNYYIQSFVDRDTVPFGGLEACSVEELEKFREIVRPHVKNIEIRGV